MACKTCKRPAVGTVKRVAPEDLAPGMFVCAMAAVGQCWPDTDCVPAGTTLRALRLVYTPQDGGVPVKVVSVSLPFVLVESFDRRASVVDTRTLRLARVKKKHAKKVFAALARSKALDGAPAGGDACPY